MILNDKMTECRDGDKQTAQANEKQKKETLTKRGKGMKYKTSRSKKRTNRYSTVSKKILDYLFCSYSFYCFIFIPFFFYL